MNTTTIIETKVSSYMESTPKFIASHNDVPGISCNVTPVKACIFYRDRVWETGRSLPEYLTVVLLVPTAEFTKTPSTIGQGQYKDHLATNGVFIHVIGTKSHISDKDKELILPRYRITWTRYSKYLKEFGWTYLTSTGKYEGTSVETLRCRAYTAINRHKIPYNKEYQACKPIIERDFRTLCKVIDNFTDASGDLWFLQMREDNIDYMKIRKVLKQSLLYSQFNIWKKAPVNAWDKMKERLVKHLKRYFEETNPQLLTETSTFDGIVEALNKRLDEAKVKIFD